MYMYIFFGKLSFSQGFVADFVFKILFFSFHIRITPCKVVLEDISRSDMVSYISTGIATNARKTFARRQSRGDSHAGDLRAGLQSRE